MKIHNLIQWQIIFQSVYSWMQRKSGGLSLMAPKQTKTEKVWSKICNMPGPIIRINELIQGISKLKKEDIMRKLMTQYS